MVKPRPRGINRNQCRHQTRVSQEERRDGKLYAVVTCLEKGCGKVLERRELKR